MGRPKKFEETEVVDRAMDLFWCSGYDGTSMTELTKVMNMNAPSIYFAFGSKRGLFDAVLKRYEHRREGFKNAIVSAPTAREAAEQLLFGASEWLTSPNEPLGCLMIQCGLSTGAANRDVSAELANRRNRLISLLAECFRQGQRNGDLAADADPEELAKFYHMVFIGLCVQASSGTSREELQNSAHLAMKSWPA